jgi:hypothetical protein
MCPARAKQITSPPCRNPLRRIRFIGSTARNVVYPVGGPHILDLYTYKARVLKFGMRRSATNGMCGIERVFRPFRPSVPSRPLVSQGVAPGWHVSAPSRHGDLTVARATCPRTLPSCPRALPWADMSWSLRGQWSLIFARPLWGEWSWFLEAGARGPSIAHRTATRSSVPRVRGGYRRPWLGLLRP